MKWYYSKDGQQIGPVDFTDIERLHETGALTSDTLVWQQGTPNWVKLSTVLWASPASSVPLNPPEAASAPVTQSVTTAPVFNPAPTPSGKTNTLAIVSLVLGILSPFCCGCLTGIPAIICGHLALKNLATSGEKGSGFAKAGLILGYLAIVITIVYTIYMMMTGGFEAIMEASKATQSPAPSSGP